MRLFLLEMAVGPDGTPVPAYLVRFDDGANLLIDTWYPKAMAGGAMRIDPEHHVVAGLAALGLTPDDVQTVVVSHLDPDHAGALDAFPAADLVIQADALAAARDGRPRYARTRDQWDDPARRWRMVDGDVELRPGVELIATPGHAPGHQSVLLRLPETGPVLLAIDALPLDLKGGPAEARETGPFDEDPAGVRASARKLLDLADRERVALTVYGHDAAQ